MSDLKGIGVLSDDGCPHCDGYCREIRRLRKIVEGLTGRVAAQSELLSKRAERPRADDMITSPSEKHGPPHGEISE